MVRRLLLLLWCTAITGYKINNNNSNTQPSAQTNKQLLLGKSLPTRVKTTTNKIYAWCHNSNMHNEHNVLCKNNGIICRYIVGTSLESTSACTENKHYVPTTCYNASKYQYYLIYYMLIFLSLYMPPIIHHFAMSSDNYSFLTRKFRKRRDILNMHLWYDWSNSIPIRLLFNSQWT